MVSVHQGLRGSEGEGMEMESRPTVCTCGALCCAASTSPLPFADNKDAVNVGASTKTNVVFSPGGWDKVPFNWRALGGRVARNAYANPQLYQCTITRPVRRFTHNAAQLACRFASIKARDKFNPGISGFTAHSDAATAPRKHSLTTATLPRTCPRPSSLLFRTNLSTTRAVGVAPQAKRHLRIRYLAGGRTARSSAVSCASDSSGASRRQAAIHCGRIMAARTVSELQATATWEAWRSRKSG